MSIQEQYTLMKEELNERQWRHYLAMEALRIGPGGIARVMRDSGSDFKTIKRGISEVQQGESYRVREIASVRLEEAGRNSSRPTRAWRRIWMRCSNPKGIR